MGDSRQPSLAAASPAPSGKGPIADATARLLSWLADATNVPVVIGPPADDRVEPGLLVWPLELIPEQELRGVGPREPFRFRVRFLLAVGGTDDPAPVLDEVLVAAVAAPDITVVLEPLHAASWQALRARPRAAILLEASAHIARASVVVPLVRTPLQVRDVAMRQLTGQVVGPAGVPLSGVHVQDISTGKATTTSTDGSFVLAGVVDSERARLRLIVKGRTLLADVDGRSAPSTGSGESSGSGHGDGTDQSAGPTVIHCDIEET